MIFPVNSPTGLQQPMQFNAMVNRRQAGLSLGSMPLGSLNHKSHPMAGGGGGGHRPILVSHSHPMQMGHMGHGGVSQQVPLLNSPSSGNILHVCIELHLIHVSYLIVFAPLASGYHKSGKIRTRTAEIPPQQGTDEYGPNEQQPESKLQTANECKCHESLHHGQQSDANGSICCHEYKSIATFEIFIVRRCVDTRHCWPWLGFGQ